MTRRRFVAAGGIALAVPWTALPARPRSTPFAARAVLYGRAGGNRAVREAWRTAPGLAVVACEDTAGGDAASLAKLLRRTRPELLGLTAAFAAPDVFSAVREQGVRMVYWHSPWFVSDRHLAAVAQVCCDLGLAIAVGSSPQFSHALRLASNAVVQGQLGQFREIRGTIELDEDRPAFLAQCQRLTAAIGAFAGPAEPQSVRLQTASAPATAPRTAHDERCAVRLVYRSTAGVRCRLDATNDVGRSRPLRLAIEGEEGVLTLDPDESETQFRPGLDGSLRRHAAAWDVVSAASEGLRSPPALAATALLGAPSATPAGDPFAALRPAVSLLTSG